MTTALATRAVLRRIEQGVGQNGETPCPGCGQRMKFRSWRDKAFMVLANVYEGDRWARVEYWHDPCYQEAGEPHGHAEV